MFSLAQAQSPRQIATVREMFQAYAAGLEVDLAYQNFAAELAGLPGPYASPAGRLLLAGEGEAQAGCVALQALAPGLCEMKRLYVHPRFRGRGLGRILAEAAIREARAIGYGAMRLDSLPSMGQAQGLYRTLGFTEIAAYYDSPVTGTVFMELTLS